MRYISERNISFSMKVKGRKDSVRISFTSLSTGGSTYSTDSENVIEALEKSPMYGKFYHRAPECMNDSIRSKREVKPVIPKRRVTDIDTVESWQEAAEYLIEKFGSTAKLTTPEAIMREAEEKGVLFSRLN